MTRIVEEWAEGELQRIYNALLRELAWDDPDLGEVRRCAGRVIALVTECRLSGDLSSHAMALAGVTAGELVDAEWDDACRLVDRQVATLTERWRPRTLEPS
jgi:hypothetical protein